LRLGILIPVWRELQGEQQGVGVAICASIADKNALYSERMTFAIVGIAGIARD
jgi:hypothetical protein